MDAAITTLQPDGELNFVLNPGIGAPGLLLRAISRVIWYSDDKLVGERPVQSAAGKLQGARHPSASASTSTATLK